MCEKENQSHKGRHERHDERAIQQTKMFFFSLVRRQERDLVDPAFLAHDKLGIHTPDYLA